MKEKLELVKNFVMTHKKVFIACSAVLLVSIITIIAVSFSGKKEEEPSQKENLTKYLEEMGKDFYENYYYNAVGSSEESRTNFLQKYSEIGIKVNLDNLSRYNGDSVKERIGSFKNQETGEDCNKENTKVIIYPQEPYGVTDYKIDTILVCDSE